MPQTLKEKVKNLFGYYENEEVSISEIIKQMDERGRVNQKTIVELIKILFEGEDE